MAYAGLNPDFFGRDHNRDLLPGNLWSDIPAILLGKKLFDWGSPAARGKMRFYRGTAPWNRAKTVESGIPGDNALVSKHSGRLRALFMRSMTDPKSVLSGAKDGVKDIGKYTWKDLLRGPAAVELPATEKARVTKVPVNDMAPKVPVPRLLKWWWLRGTRGLQGGAAPSEMVGNKSFKWLSGAGMKARPFRMLAGVGAAGAGASLMAGGVHDTLSKLNPFSKSSGFKQASVTRALGAAGALWAPDELARLYGGTVEPAMRSDGSWRDKLDNVKLQYRALASGHEPVGLRQGGPTSAFAADVPSTRDRLLLGLTLLKSPPLLRKFIATTSDSAPGVLAHETGHAEQPDWLKTPLYQMGKHAPAWLGAAAAALPKGRGLVGASALSALPMLAAEVDASARGSKMLHDMGREDVLKPWAGVPSYAIGGLGPAAIALTARRLMKV